MQKLTLILFTASIMCSCIPKKQYEATTAELNYYRSQAAKVDSLESQVAISTYNNQSAVDIESQRMIREVESLKATNISLNKSFQDLSKRFEEQVQRNIELTQITGSQVNELQQSLAEQKSELSRKENELRQKEIQLYEREQELAAVSPEAYSKLTGLPPVNGDQTNPLNNSQRTAINQNQLETSFKQVLSNYSYTDVRYGNKSNNDVVLTLSQSILFRDGYSISESGKALISRIASVLQVYPDAQIQVVGHSHAIGNQLVALETSTDRAIAITQQLVKNGVNTQNILAAGKGFYDPLTNDNSISGQATNRRTDIIVILP